MRKRKRVRSPLGVARTHEMRVAVLLVLVEVAFLLYAYYRGIGPAFLQMSFVFIPLSCFSYVLSVKCKADKYLVLINTILLNIGFLVQILAGATTEKAAAKKCVVAYAAAYLSVLVYRYLAEVMSYDVAILIYFSVQMALCLLLHVVGTEIQSGSDQGAKILIEIGNISFQPLEIVKVLYIFVLAILLCKEEREKHGIFGLPRNFFLLLYTVVLGYWMIRFSEYGTLFIMCVVAGLMMIIYSSSRGLVLALALFASGSAYVGWKVLQFLHPESGQLGKLYKRLRYFLTPEKDYMESGYQGVLVRKALTVGELFGPDSERYLFKIPMETNDMIFAKLVQCCGIVMGIVVILTMVFFLQRGMNIARNAKDGYFSGLAMGLTLLITVQAIYHIAYNCGYAPISGNALYMVSQGFTATTTGMAMIGILLVISTGKVKRKVQHEKEMQTAFERATRRTELLLWPGRRRTQRQSNRTQ